MKSVQKITEIALLTCVIFIGKFLNISAQSITPSTEPGQKELDKQDDNKSFLEYSGQLRTKYASKDYLRIIFENEVTRKDFATFVNSHLTTQVKEDLKSLRVFQKVEGVEMPAIAFSPGMDTWLGILPQWKRFKKFMFGEIEKYLSSHEDILQGPDVPTYRPIQRG